MVIAVVTLVSNTSCYEILGRQSWRTYTIHSASAVCNESLRLTPAKEKTTPCSTAEPTSSWMSVMAYVRCKCEKDTVEVILCKYGRQKQGVPAAAVPNSSCRATSAYCPSVSNQIVTPKGMLLPARCHASATCEGLRASSGGHFPN